jgi:hypothetical protein
MFFEQSIMCQIVFQKLYIHCSQNTNIPVKMLKKSYSTATITEIKYMSNCSGKNTTVYNM